MSVLQSRITNRLPQFSLRFLSVFLVIVAALAVVHAQMPGSSRGLPTTSGGIHTIKGRVFFPDDQAANVRLKVRLESANTFGGHTAVTDEDGRFIFTRLEAGPYTVVVEGDKVYETAREPVAIDREASPGGRTIDVPIYLKLKAVSAALAGVPKPALDLYNKAQESIRAGDSKTAIEHLEKAVSIYANFSQAFSDLGVQYLRVGQIDKAAEALATAVKLAPVDFRPRLNLGIALLNQKKFPEAEEQLRVALTKNPSSPLAHMYLGMVLMNQKKLDEAQKELEVATVSKSNEVGVAHKYLGGIYWGRRDYKKAADELETYLQMVPKASDAERTRAAIKELRGKQ